MSHNFIVWLFPCSSFAITITVILIISLLLGCTNDTVVDLGFALDGSNSIDANEYRLTKDFVKDIIRMFSISKTGTHVGLLEYAARAVIRVRFDEFSETDELLKDVEGLKQSRGASTNIGVGLDKTLQLFSKRYGARDEVRLVQTAGPDCLKPD